jgi:hypothetical protein
MRAARTAGRSPGDFEHTRPEEVLVALLDDQVAGFICLRPASPLVSNAYVLVVGGLQ